MSTWNDVLPPCQTGKATFVTEHEAQVALVPIGMRARSRGETRYPRTAYQCATCRLWHLTSRERTLAEAMGPEASA